MSLQFLETSLENPNLRAFMLMIRKSEGTSSLDGYKYLFGSSPSNSRRFEDFSKHPNIREPFGKDNWSSAAGAYQILFKTWEVIRIKYNLPDFSPSSQDIACADLISNVNALQLVMDGHFEEAMKLCNTVWASLYNSPYGQPTHSLTDYITWYTNAGGVISS